MLHSLDLKHQTGYLHLINVNLRKLRNKKYNKIVDNELEMRSNTPNIQENVENSTIKKSVQRKRRKID